MAEPESKQDGLVHVGEWPGISDLFLISLSREGMEKLRIVYDKCKGKVLYRRILQDLLEKALIEFDESKF